MYYPMPWHATSDCTPDMSPHDCKFAMKITYPPGEECTHNSTTNGCSASAAHTAWFTNFTSVPEVTLPEDMFDQWTDHTETEAGLHPWNSPGAAPTFGNGCGVNGGNPDGCEGEGNVYRNVKEIKYR